MRVMEEDRGAVIASVVVVVRTMVGKESGFGAERLQRNTQHDQGDPQSGASGSMRLGRG